MLPFVPQTTHFKLINAMARAAQELDLPKGHDHSAFQLHSDLFASGIERILLVRALRCTYPLRLIFPSRLPVKRQPHTTQLSIWNYHDISRLSLNRNLK